MHTRCTGLKLGVVAGSTFLSPTDEANQDDMEGSAQRVVVARARTPRDAAEQLCLEYIGSLHPYLELEGGVWSVERFKGVPPEAVPRCIAYTSVDHDGQVAVEVDASRPEVYELVSLVVHLTGCLYAEEGGRLRRPLRA